MIVLFPTYASRLPGLRRWRANLAGMVVSPLPEKSRRRVLAVAVLRRLFDLNEEQLRQEVFRRRSAAFLFRRMPGERVQVEFAGRRIDAGRTDRVGHFNVQIDLDESVLETVAAGGGAQGSGREIAYTAWSEGLSDDGEPAAAGPFRGSGRIHLVEEEGLSVISDIDDTVKITNVANRRELLANTLFREFQAVPGMVDVYREWHQAGTAFHYVSASPWQLAECLGGFFDQCGMPGGSMHLKLFRLKDSTPLGRLPSRKRSKRRAIEQIMDDFPRRRFLLVGDSGERDPEVYVAIARRRPAQVAGVVIRRVAGHASEQSTDRRFDRLARRLPRGALHVFTSAEQIRSVGHH